MMNSAPIRQHHPTPHSAEEGYILIWVIFLIAVFTLALSIAVPDVAKQIKRDRELETMRRGKQYIRAIQLYYRKFHAYPPNVNALVNTNQIRFLRKKYIDPTTGKDDWKPILFGQAKTQTLGFFGQPIAGAGSAGGSVMAGVGPSGGSGIGGSTFGSGGSTFGSGSSSFGSGSSSFGSGSSSFGSGSSSFGSGIGSGGSSTGAGGGAGGSGSNGNSSSSSSTDSGQSGQTFGGAGIIGYSPAGTGSSILVYKKKSHYNEWEFVYDPLSDMVTQPGNTGNIGQPASSTTTPVGSSAFGNSSTFGSGTGSNSTAPSPTAPASTPETTPQQ